MPNHVSNIILVTGSAENLTAFKEHLFSKGLAECGDNGHCVIFNFNSIIPMPRELIIEQGDIVSAAFNWMEQEKHLSTSELEPTFYKKLQQHLFSKMDLKNATVGNLIPFFKADTSLLVACCSSFITEKIKADNIEKFGYPTWYEWRLANWRTKWEAYNQFITDLSDEKLEFGFDTAWSPPEAVYRAIAEHYPDISMTVHYIDEGGMFAGIYEISDGQLTDYPVSDDEFRAFTMEHFGWEYEPEDEE